jgi:hypothetical protein
MKDILQAFIALCVICGFAFGAVHYFAAAADLQLVELRLDQKIVNDAIRDIEQRIWLIEERNTGSPDEWQDARDKRSHKELQQELEYLKEKRKRLLK